MLGTQHGLTGEFQGVPFEKASLHLTIYWESLAKAPDKVPTSLENLFCAGAEKHGRVRPNSPDKVLLCLTICDAVYAHHKEKTDGLGHHAPRRSIYDKIRKQSSKAQLERKTLATFCALAM